MKRYLLFLVLSAIMIISLVPFTSIATSEMGIRKQQMISSPIEINQNEQPMGVVVIDDLHDNDYTNGDMELLIPELENMGYIAQFASYFDNWEDAVNASNYLIISAPYSEISAADIAIVKNWFETTSGNLLIASRGDYEAIHYDSLNLLLDELSTEMNVQDDNVYTTDSNAYREWYIDTDNFNSSFPYLFEETSSISFFSPSSITHEGSAEVLVTAEKQAYQTNQNGDPPVTIYDDTDDNEGGESIPLAVMDNVTLGSDEDRIITVGTTLWSDFDFGDSFADDIAFFYNILAYFREATLDITGEITLNIEDVWAPVTKISFPHQNAILSGTIQLQIDAYDPFGIASYEISINDTVVSDQPTYDWDTTTYEDGTYIVSVQVTDDAGNTGTATATYRIIQDFVPQQDDFPKIMTYNIKESGVYDAWFDVVVEENPDILILVETGDFDDNNNAILNQVITDLNGIFFDEVAYEGYTLQDIANSFNGITILSRFDLKSNEKLSSLTSDDGATHSIPLPFLHSVLNINGQDLHVIGGHLTCCPEESDWNARKIQQESIINFMDDLGDVPIVYLGDMNAVSPDDVNPDDEVIGEDLGTEPIEMIVDPSHSKASKEHTFVDVHSYLNPDTAVNSFIGSILSRIDYIFVNQYFADRLISSTTGDTISADKGSDHVPVDVIVNVSSTLTPGEFDIDFPSQSSDTTNTPFFVPIVILLLVPILLRWKKSS